MAGVMYLVAIVLLMPPLAIACFVASTAKANQRLTAVQLANALTIVCLVLMTFLFDQSSSVDLALTGAFLAVPGTYLFTTFMERWI